MIVLLFILFWFWCCIFSLFIHLMWRLTILQLFPLRLFLSFIFCFFHFWNFYQIDVRYINSFFRSFNLFYFIFNCYWRTIDLQCYVNFCCAAKWFSYAYINTFFFVVLLIMVYHRILIIVPCYNSNHVVFHSIYNSLHLLIPTSQSSLCFKEKIIWKLAC